MAIATLLNYHARLKRRVNCNEVSSLTETNTGPTPHSAPCLLYNSRAAVRPAIAQIFTKKCACLPFKSPSVTMTGVDALLQIDDKRLLHLQTLSSHQRRRLHAVRRSSTLQQCHLDCQSVPERLR